MFNYEFGQKEKKKTLPEKDFSFIDTISPILWSEHCHECGAPLCYSTCIKYRKRKDGRCRLFENGISIIHNIGLNGYAAHIIFQGWGKLEAVFRPYQVSKRKIKFVETKAKYALIFFKILSFLFDSNKKIKLFLNYGQEYKNKLSNKINRKSVLIPDAFYSCIYNPGVETSIIIETKSNSNIHPYKKTFLIKQGFNEIIIPYEEFAINRGAKSYISLYPTKEHELIFYALDFVTFNKNYKFKISKTKKQTSSKIIKCVAWDLDNTIWDGILIEGEVRLKNKVVSIMKDLDSRGIINSIISKNNKEDALAKLNEFGLTDLIVMPQINWNPKSFNLSSLAKQMNIGIDSICFVDDSPFELEEVSTAYPEVLCININDIDNILTKEIFNVPVTEDGKKRRLTYKMKEMEQLEYNKWEGNMDGFLKSCNIHVIISKPKEDELLRCFELVQRTNQLNSSGRRLTFDEIKSYISSDSYSSYVIKCNDKFGEYGIVGFSIFDKNEYTITDFVISCRVANKTIEQTFIQYIYKKYCKNTQLIMDYKKTLKNGPLFNIITSLNMQLIKTEGDINKYAYNGTCNNYDIVTLIASEN